MRIRWERDALLSGILAAIGAASGSLSVVSCGGNAETDRNRAAGGNASSAGSGTAGGAAGSISLGGSVNTAGTGVSVSFGGTAGSAPVTGGAGGSAGATPPPPDYDASVVAQGSLSGDAPCAVAGDPPSMWEVVCLAAPAAGAQCADAYRADGVKALYNCGLYQAADLACDAPSPPKSLPDAPAGSCCYVLGGGCAVGRPFIVAGELRRAHSVESRDWLRGSSPELGGLDANTRRALSDAYLQDGVAEHASVASFARFTLQCLALGAPADIVAAAQRAGLEEVEHALLAFGLASAYAGKALGPGALDIRGALTGAQDIAGVARDVAREGCIAETLFALLLAAARDAAVDPVVQATLALNAEQEMEHALLAWRFVGWALEQGDAATRASVAEVFAHAGEWVGFGAVTTLPGQAEAMRAHGYLPLSERRAIARAGLRDIIAPAARALLSSVGARGTISCAAEGSAEVCGTG